MGLEPLDLARSILAELQRAVDARDAERLAALFGDSAVLIGSAGDGRDAEGLHRYLAAVVEQPGALRWEWDEIVPFHQADGALGFAAFGDVVLTEGDAETRAPIRATIVASRTADGWKLSHFHGSVPLTP